MDVAFQKYLQGRPDLLASAARRNLNSHNPRAVKEYRRHLEDFLDSNPIERELDIITELISTNKSISPEQQAILDSIDQRLTSAKLQAEKECSKIPAHPWSPKLRDAQSIVRYWQLWLSEIRTTKDLSQQQARLPTLPKDAVLDEAPTVATAKKQIRDAKKQVHHILDDAHNIRQQHLQERADMAAFD